MTWSRMTTAPAFVQAFKTTSPTGATVMQLSVGNQITQLSEEDAASLGGYLLGATNNESTDTPGPTL